MNKFFSNIKKFFEIFFSNRNAKHKSARRFSNDSYSSEDLIDGSGEVKFFNQSKGFGFVSINGSDQDAFIHINVLQKNNINDLNAGDHLYFKMIKTDRNLKIVRLVQDQS